MPARTQPAQATAAAPVPSGAVLHGDNMPTSAARDEKRVLVLLFLTSAFLFFAAYQLFGVGAAAGITVLFLVLAFASHHVRLSRDFPFLHLSLAQGDAVSGGGSGFRGTVGMDAAAEIPAAFEYKRDHAATTGWAQCAICLGLVRLGEAVRRLPSRGHMFHAGCIENWLHAHATFPLCRAAVSAAVPEPTA